MNKIVLLTKVFLKSSFQTMNTNIMGENTKQKPRKKANIIIYLIAIIYLVGLIGFFSFNAIKTLQEFGQETIFVGIILLGLGFLTLFQSIFSSINILYFTKDIEFILPLPLKPYQIVMAKTNVMIVTEYVFAFVIGLIPLTIYGILTEAGFAFYPIMIIILALFPIVPMLISSLISIIVMSFSKFMKDKNKFQLIAGLISIILVISITLNTNQKQEITEEQMMQMMVKANGMVDTIGNYFPTLKPAIGALINTSMGNSLLQIGKVIAITAIMYLAYIFIAQKLYLRGAVGNLYSNSKTRKKLNEEKAFRTSKLGSTYVKKELKILFRNPIYLMQCVLPAIIMPILFIGITIPQFASNANVPEMQEAMKVVQTIPTTLSIFIILGAIQFFSMMIYVSVTAISRDGQNATFMKYIPVPLEKQLWYKAIPNVILSIIMITITIGIIQFILRLPIIMIILCFMIAILMSILQSLLMILVDLKKPKLQWDSEYAVVKQNMNLMWPAILGMVTILALVILAVLTQAINAYIICTGIIFVYIVLIYSIYKYIQKNAIKLMENVY